jgi:hypothetical protein
VTEHIKAVNVDVEGIARGQPLKVLADALHEAGGPDIDVAPLTQLLQEAITHFPLGAQARHVVVWC